MNTLLDMNLLHTIDIDQHSLHEGTLCVHQKSGQMFAAVRYD